MRGNTREITLWQVARAEVGQHLSLQRTGEIGDLVYRLPNVANAVNAEAIGEQYQPVPKTRPGLAVALADRLDSLVGLFAAGAVPTGAKDPFGLRRAAIGIVQPLIEHDVDFDLDAAVKKAAQEQPVETAAETQKQISDFITVEAWINAETVGVWGTIVS